MTTRQLRRLLERELPADVVRQSERDERIALKVLRSLTTWGVIRPAAETAS